MTPNRAAARIASAAATILGLAIVLGAPAFAQEERPNRLSFEERPDLWAIVLGQHVSEQPDNFQEYACGSNGGPPSIRLTGFAGFATCAAEDATGLHEVQFRYDDALEYWARAMGAAPLIEQFEGTKVFNHPVVLSILVDDDGIVRGLRAVTDDRVPDRVRQLAYTLASAARSYLGSEGWTCEDIPAAEGEQPMTGRLVKQDCTKVDDDGRLMRTEARLLRRPGQTLFDPANNQVRTGYFTSTGRLEIFDPSFARTGGAE